MKKEQTFRNMHLVPMGLVELDAYLTRPGGIFDHDHVAGFELTSADGGEWLFASSDDFLLEYEPLLYACYQRSSRDFNVRIINMADRGNLYSKVTVIAPDNQTIDDIFNIVEKFHEQSLFFPPDPNEEARPRPEKKSLMRKTKTFKHMQLAREGLKELDQYLTCQGGIFGDPHCSLFEIVYPDGSRRAFDKSPAFLEEYFPLFYSRYQRSRPGFELSIVNFHDSRDLYTTVTVTAQDRRTIYDIFNIIDEYHTQSICFADPKKSGENLYGCLKRAGRTEACGCTRTGETYLVDPATTQVKPAPAQGLNAGASS